MKATSADGESPQPPQSGRLRGRPRVLLLSDGDAVAGTLRRLGRFAEHLAAEADLVMATLSDVAPIGVGLPDVPVQRIASAAAMNMDDDVWAGDYLLPRLDRLIRAGRTEVLVTDGAFPASVLRRVERAHGLSRIEVGTRLDLVAHTAGTTPGAHLTIEVGEVDDAPPTSASGRAEARRRAETPARAVVPPVWDPAVREVAGDENRRARDIPVEPASAAGVDRPTVVLDLAGLSPDTTAAVEDGALDWFAAHRPGWTVALLDSVVARRGTEGVERVLGGPTPELVRRTVGVVAMPGARAVCTWAASASPVLWLTEGTGAEEPIRGAARRHRPVLRPGQLQAARERARAAVHAGRGRSTELHGPQNVPHLVAQLTAELEALFGESSADAATVQESERIGPGPMHDGAGAAAEIVMEHARRHSVGSSAGDEPPIAPSAEELHEVKRPGGGRPDAFDAG